ncbi:MAG: STAS/SEC14 domain-containing protein [Devosiaceae bacterium]|nr:STAS/SEC14 domain-containing protein [Devosiaceae bacterium MH13]
MLHIAKPAPNRLDITLDGSLDADAMRTGLDTLISEAEGIENGLMLYTISNFAMPSPGALAVELGRLPKLLALIGRFDRCAVLTDAAWLRTAAEVEGALIPGLAIKAFEAGETDAAEAWLTQTETS